MDQLGAVLPIDSNFLMDEYEGQTDDYAEMVWEEVVLGGWLHGFDLSCVCVCVVSGYSNGLHRHVCGTCDVYMHARLSQ